MQRDFFDDSLDDPKPRTIQERFERFHAGHPDVYSLFKRFAFELLRTGHRRYGAKSIMERIRWHVATSSGASEDFKLNNIYTSRYARMLIEEHPEFEGFFELRALQAP